jgi:hypothetical protein
MPPLVFSGMTYPTKQNDSRPLEILNQSALSVLRMIKRRMELLLIEESNLPGKAEQNVMHGEFFVGAGRRIYVHPVDYMLSQKILRVNYQFVGCPMTYIPNIR